MESSERDDIKNSLKELDETIEAFVFFFSQNFDYTKRINTRWNAKDILGHIVKL
ncbi:MAG: hypothetical protein AAF348_08710 [Bacteroidota bacterium]